MKKQPIQLPNCVIPAMVEGTEPDLLVQAIRYGCEHPDSVLQGFRLNRQTVKMPVVRQRMVNEALRDSTFATTLVEAWRLSAPDELHAEVAKRNLKELRDEAMSLARRFGGETIWVRLVTDERKGVRELGIRLREELEAVEAEKTASSQEHRASPPAQQPPLPFAEPGNAKTEELKSKNARLLEDNKLLAARLASALKELEQSRAGLAGINKEIADLHKLAERINHRLEREERARVAAETEITELNRRLKEVKKPPAAKPVPATPSRIRTETWPDVITRLLHHRRHAAAIQFLEEFLMKSPQDFHAHELLCRAYIETKTEDGALAECCWVTDWFLARGRMANAAYYMCAAIEIDPRSTRALRLIDTLVKRVDTKDAEIIEELRRALRKFRARNPEAYKIVSAEIARADLKRHQALEGKPVPKIHKDTLLSFEAGGRKESISASSIIRAINSNETTLVEFVRKAMDKLKATAPAQYKTIVGVLEAQDAGISETLSGRVKPVVVDGSNVAHAYVSTSGKPRLQNILLLRQKLRRLKYFPIIIYADANLRYKVDQRGSIEQFIESQEILPVDSGTDADETIIREARRRKCPVITNDRMIESDPNNEVEKIRFDVDQRTAELRY